MKTKTFGSFTYMVTKYYVTEDEKMKVAISRWSEAKPAFRECEEHRKKHGAYMAFVFKAKQCKLVE